METAKNLPDAEKQQSLEFPATEEGLAISKWWYLPMLLLGVAWLLIMLGSPKVYTPLFLSAGMLGTTYVNPKARQRRGSGRLCRLVVTARGVLLEYPERKESVSWGDITGLKTWTDKRERVTAIGLRLKDGSRMIVRDLANMEGLRAELEKATKLNADAASGRLNAFATDPGLGGASYMVVLLLLIPFWVTVQRWLGNPMGDDLPFKVFLAKMVLFFAGLVLVMASLAASWGRLPSVSWERATPQELWSLHLAPKPMLRRTLAACLLGSGTLLIVLSFLSF